MRSTALAFVTLLILSACTTSSGGESAAPAPVVSGPKIVTMQNENCRSGPGDSAEVAEVMKPGAAAIVIGKLPDSTWLEVSTATNPASPCWVEAAVVTVIGGLDMVPVNDMPVSP